MTPDALAPHVEEAQEVLRSFFAQLLGADAPLTAGPPGPADGPDVPDGAVVLGGQPAGGAPFAVVLGAGWAGRLAEAMVGGPVPDDEAGDLLGEAAAQAYGALRTGLVVGDDPLPEATFTVVGPADLVGLDWRVPFSLGDGAGPLEGAVFLAAEVLAAAPPEAAPPAAQGASQGAPEPVWTPSPDAPPAPPVSVAAAAFEELGPEAIGDGAAPDLRLLSDVELDVTVELGRRRLPLAEILRLTTGSVVELDKMVGQPLSVFANGRLIAEGEAVVVDDQFGVRVTGLASASGVAPRRPTPRPPSPGSPSSQGLPVAPARRRID